MSEGSLSEGPLDTQYRPGFLFHFPRRFNLEDAWARQRDDLAAHSLGLNAYEDDVNAFSPNQPAQSSTCPSGTPAGCPPSKRARLSVLLDCPQTPPGHRTSLPATESPYASPVAAPLAPLQSNAVRQTSPTPPPFANLLEDLSPLTPLSSPGGPVSPLALEPALLDDSGESRPPLAALPGATGAVSWDACSLGDLSPLTSPPSDSDSPPSPLCLKGLDEAQLQAVAPDALEARQLGKAARPPKRARSPGAEESTDEPPGAGHKKRAPKKRGFSKQGEGARSRRGRKGERFQAAEGDLKTARALGLRNRALRTANIANPLFSMERDASVSKSGWMGRPVKKATRAELSAAIDNGTIWDIMADFTYLHHVEDQTSLGVDAEGRVFLYQTQRVPWIGEMFGDVYTRAEVLIDGALDMDTQRTRDRKGVRGPHFALLLGHYRQYSDWPTLTGFHSNNFVAAEEFRLAASVQRLTGVVESVTRAGFPHAAARFLKSVEWYKDLAAKGKSKNKRKAARAMIEPLFGLFWNFCFNFAHRDQARVHCLPHADTKNIVGVCVLVVYQKPGHQFNHRKRSWLVLWETKLIVEMPPWTITAYPSSLLLHFNIDLKDFQFVCTDGDLPTKENSEEFGPSDSSGRGSIVYFNEASIYQSSETGFSTLREAKKAGVDTDRDYGDDIAKAFSDYRTCIRMA